VARVAFIVPGTPKGKGRPRFSRKSGAAYTPKETRSHEAYVKMLAAQAMDDALLAPFEGPVHVVIGVMCEVPVSWSKKKKALAAANVLRPTGGDLDNAVKLATDAMNSIVYKDDRQIYRIEATRMFADKALTAIEVFG